MPSSRAALAPAARSVGASGGRSTSTGWSWRCSGRPQLVRLRRPGSCARAHPSPPPSGRPPASHGGAGCPRRASPRCPWRPGSPSEGSPRSAMKSGTQLGRDPVAALDLGGVDPLRPRLPRPPSSRTVTRLVAALEHVAVAGEHQRRRRRAFSSRRARAPIRSSASSSVVLAHAPAERAEEVRRARELVRQVVGHGGPMGVVGGVAARPGRRAASGPKQATVARAPCSSATARIVFTEPSRAFTGRPSAPLIESGSAKNAR